MPRPRRVDPDRILEAAAHVIADRGITALRLHDVADAADVSVGLIQYRFGTRDELVVAALRHALRDGYARFAREVEGEADPWERLRGLMASVFRDEPEMLERWRRWAMLTAALVRDPSLGAAVGEAHARWAGVVVATIEEGIAAGRLAPACSAADAAFAMLGMMDGVGFAALAGAMPLEAAHRIAEQNVAQMLGVRDAVSAAAD